MKTATGPDTWGTFLTYTGLGSGTLAAWNSFILGADYFESRFPGQHANRLFTVFYLPVNLSVVAGLTYWNTLLSTRTRIRIGLAGSALGLALVPLLGALPPSGLTLAATLGLLCCVGVTDGLTQPALFAEAAQGPPLLTHALVTGTALAGLAACALRVATKALLPPTPRGLAASAAAFFWVATAWVAGCLALYLTRAQRPREGVEETTPGARTPTPASPPPRVELSPSVHGASEEDAEASLLPRGPAPEAVLRSPYLVPLGTAKAGVGEVRATLRTIWRLSLATCLIYTVTLAIFPGVLVEDARAPSGDAGRGWFVVSMMTLFNLGDLAGKGGPTLVPALRWSRQGGILGAVCLRALFIPAFHLAVSAPAGLALCTLGLGFTNGVLTSSAMATAPAHVAPSQAGLAGSIMVLSLDVGLVLGAALSFLWLL
ncbi:hypothetical protein ACKKBF_B10025 [Auxenochlorella protothecoides x Auxenochlorella symbiontica]